MRVVLIGAVNSTNQILKALIRNNSNIVGVLGLDPKNSKNIAGFCDMEGLAKKNGLNFKHFSKINDQNNYDWLRSLNPDVIFAVGFSQLVGELILKLPKKGCVGFHPTDLPRGRGRAPIAWLILNQERFGAACFFEMGKGADDGAILAKSIFEVEDEDYALDIEAKILKAIDVALDAWLPELNKGNWESIPQDDEQATFFAKRSMEDAWIDWNSSSKEIHRIVRACGNPYPGAISCKGSRKLIIHKAGIINKPFVGVPGRVVDNLGGRPLVQTGEGQILLESFEIETTEGDFESNPKIAVGVKLGINQNDIYKILHQTRK